MKKEFKVKFRGVRGSYPTPDKDKLKFGGNTSCVEVCVGGFNIALDAGTGIISLGEKLFTKYISSGSDIKSREPINSIILITHTHQDHLQGLPFFKPFYIETSKINLFGPINKTGGIKEAISKLAFGEYFPIDFDELSAGISITNIKENEVLVLNPKTKEISLQHITTDEVDKNLVTVFSYKSQAHPKDGVLIYKICYQGKILVFATDKEDYIGIDRKLAIFARNADLLIHDAQYTYEDYTSAISPKQGFGHSTPEMAIELAKQANVKKLALFHLDTTYNDTQLEEMEKEAKAEFKEAFVSYEGLELSLL